MKTYFKEIRYWFKQGGWFESLTLRVHQTRRHFPPSLEAEDSFLGQTEAETLQSDRLTGERTEKAAQSRGQSGGSWLAGAQEESHFWVEGAPPLPRLLVPMRLLERALPGVCSCAHPALTGGRRAPPQNGLRERQDPRPPTREVAPRSRSAESSPDHDLWHPSHVLELPICFPGIILKEERMVKDNAVVKESLQQGRLRLKSRAVKRTLERDHEEEKKVLNTVIFSEREENILYSW